MRMITEEILLNRNNVHYNIEEAIFKKEADTIYVMLSHDGRNRIFWNIDRKILVSCQHANND